MQLVHRNTSGPLPTSTYVLQDAGEDVGFIQIRHRPSHGAGVPEACASHIYYEVREDRRRRGYGSKLLALGKGEARRLGLEAIVVGCFAINPTSKRIIESNSGILQGANLDDKRSAIFALKIDLRNCPE
jgi:predicted acetyltransferase